MLMNFARDTAKAQSADGQSVINQTGKYLVTIRQADTFQVKNQNIQVVRLLAESDTKARQTIELLVDGTQSDWHLRLFHALLTCIKVDSANFTAAQVRPHRRGYAEEKIESGYRCKEIEGKRVGVVLQKRLRNYTSQSGEVKETYEMRVLCFFDAQTEKTASEILGNRNAERLAQVIATLADRDDRTPQTQTQSRSITETTDNDISGCPF